MEGGCAEKKKRERERKINAKERKTETGMVKKWRLKEGSIKKDKVRQQIKGKEKRGIGDREAGQEWGVWMDGGKEHRSRNRQGFMTGERGGCSGGLGKGRVFSSVCLWWRNEFCLWILLTPPQHNAAI